MQAVWSLMINPQIKNDPILRTNCRLGSAATYFIQAIFKHASQLTSIIKVWL